MRHIQAARRKMAGLSLLCSVSACATFHEADLALQEWTREHVRGVPEEETKAEGKAKKTKKKKDGDKREVAPKAEPPGQQGVSSDSSGADATPTGANSAAAEALFESGHEAMNAKDYDTACARFAESNRLDPAVGAVLNLAICEEERGRLATAWQLFKRVMSELPAGDDRYPIAQRRASELRPRVPHVTLQLAPDAPGATEVVYDDVVFAGASFGVPLPMDPGKHELYARAPKREQRRYTFSLAPGEKKELVIEPGPGK